jgi:hypothetical protein
MDASLELYRVSRMELGPELARFPIAAHVASCAGMCLENHERAGCPLGDAPGWQDPHGQQVAVACLTEAACGAVRTKQAGRTAPPSRIHRTRDGKVDPS